MAKKVSKTKKTQKATNQKTAQVSNKKSIQIGDVAARTMLVSLDISQWGGSKLDRKVTQEVADQHQTSASDGKYIKQLISGSLIEKIHAIVSAARKEHWERTLPWFDDGFRILSAAGYLEYRKSMAKYAEDFETAVHDFINAYDEQLEGAKKRLGGLFDEKDYPQAEAVNEKFTFRHAFRPLPQRNDFRVSMGNAELEAIRESIEQNSQDAIKGAMFEVARRIGFFANHMNERLTAYSKDAKGKVSNPFRDTLVTNVRELVDLLPSLNITNDPRIEDIRVELAEMSKNDPATLRENETLRTDIAAKAKAIKDKMADFI